MLPRRLKLASQPSDVLKAKKGYLRAMFLLCSRSRQRSNKLEFNSSTMTRRAASGFGWQRESESGDGSLSLARPHRAPEAIFRSRSMKFSGRLRLRRGRFESQWYVLLGCRALEEEMNRGCASFFGQRSRMLSSPLTYVCEKRYEQTVNIFHVFRVCNSTA